MSDVALRPLDGASTRLTVAEDRLNSVRSEQIVKECDDQARNATHQRGQKLIVQASQPVHGRTTAWNFVNANAAR